MDLAFILKHVRTTEERSELVNLLEELIENNFKRDPKPISGSPFSKNATDAIYSEISKLGIANNREEIEKFLETILSEAKSLPEIRISIAIPPSENLINNLRKWSYDNNLNNVIFNIDVKSEIVAGAIIMSPEGEYADFSLSNQINKFFKEKRQEVLSLL